MVDNDQSRAVRAILQHDDVSTAAELVYYFVHELGVSHSDAWHAVRHRIPSSARAAPVHDVPSYFNAEPETDTRESGLSRCNGYS